MSGRGESEQGVTRDYLEYNELVEGALRGVVREALAEVAETGLRGAHHFYIGYKTHFPGVEMPDHLRQKYPDEITIVIQHQFWGLEVEDDYFSITLSFSGSNERLVVPFYAITSFADPGVQFALQFSPTEEEIAEDGLEKEDRGADAPRAAAPEPEETEPGDVVSLDSFRDRT